MNKSLRATVSSILLGAASTGVLAQEAAEQEQTVIVTGTRSAKAVDKIPGAINVVSEAELERTVSLTAGPHPGPAARARSVPGYPESSQAMNPIGETLRGRVPLRLFDGIPQSTPIRDGSRNG